MKVFQKIMWDMEKAPISLAMEESLKLWIIIIVRYIGEYKDDMREGSGVFYFLNGGREEG